MDRKLVYLTIFAFSPNNKLLFVENVYAPSNILLTNGFGNKTNFSFQTLREMFL